MINWKKTSPAFLSLVLCLCAVATTSARSKFVTVRGKEFVAADGRVLTLKGISIGKAQGRWHETMAIGIGLDHRHDAGAAHYRANEGEVATQRGSADFSTDQGLQRSTPAA